mgnify:CR=1 FL=1
MSTVEVRVTGQTTTWERDLGGRPSVHLSEQIVYVEGSHPELGNLHCGLTGPETTFVQQTVNGVHDVAGVVEASNGALHRTTIYIRGHHEYIGKPVVGLSGPETSIERRSLKATVLFQASPRK